MPGVFTNRLGEGAGKAGILLMELGKGVTAGWGLGPDEISLSV